MPQAVEGSTSKTQPHGKEGRNGGGDGAALRAEFGADAVRKRTLVESFVGGEAASAVKRSTHFVL